MMSIHKGDEFTRPYEFIATISRHNQNIGRRAESSTISSSGLDLRSGRGRDFRTLPLGDAERPDLQVAARARG